jgi:hypothetical protein
MTQELKDAAAEALAAVKKFTELAVDEAATNAEPLVAQATAKVRELADEVEALIERARRSAN